MLQVDYCGGKKKKKSLPEWETVAVFYLLILQASSLWMFSQWKLMRDCKGADQFQRLEQFEEITSENTRNQCCASGIYFMVICSED